MDGQPRRLMPAAPPARSYFKDVVDFIHRVVPDSTRHKSPPKADDVSWVKIRTCRSRAGHAATYMIMAYANGGQVWQLHENNEAEELLSFRGGRLSCAAIVPESSAPPTQDNLFRFRPLLAYCSTDKSSRTKAVIQFTSLKLKTAHPETISVRGWPRAIEANPSVLVVMLAGELRVYRSEDFEHVFTLEDVAPMKPTLNLQGCISLGPRWLAYPTCRAASSSSREAAVATPDTMQTMMQLAQQTGERLYYFSDKGYRTVSEFVTGRHQPTSHSHHSHSHHSHSHHSHHSHHHQQSSTVSTDSSTSASESNGTGVGYIHIVDVKETMARFHSHAADDKSPVPPSIICHFRAHISPIAAMAFNDSGTLLATADTTGQNINVFELLPGTPTGAQQLYSLQRGMTQAVIQDMAFSLDDRWIAVASHRGTVHMFPIHPRGNEINAGSHLPIKVPNASEFLQSSGAAQQQRRRQQLADPTVVRGLQKIRCIAVEADRSHRDDSTSMSRTSSTSEDLNDVSVGGIIAVHFRPPPHVDQLLTDAAVLHLLILTNEGKLNEFEMHVQRARPPPRTTGHVVGQFLGGFQKLLSRPEHPAAKSVAPPEPEPQVQTEEIALLTAPKQLWNLCRAESWPDMLESTRLLEQNSGTAPTAWDDVMSVSPGTAKQRRWLSEVEMKTHMPPHRSLWLGPQFTFNVYSAAPVGAERTKGNRSAFMKHNGLHYEPIPEERPQSRNHHGSEYGGPDVKVQQCDATVEELVQALGQVWEGPATGDGGTGPSSSSSSSAQRTRAFSLPSNPLPTQQNGNGTYASRTAMTHNTPLATTTATSKPAHHNHKSRHRRTSSSDSAPQHRHRQQQPAHRGGSRNASTSPDSDSSNPSFPQSRGLGIVLGEVTPEDEVPRVHSHVSLDGLMEAFSDDSDDY
ncbi:hypothetical protein PTSG_11998 [Salpingoeca rosetta]|uniref:Uncharacterized protein n=1 Tax=Salpingoeca rosetta (strain ATCC 50818 / BSB-021) TaxID=946362 RepID=F2U4X9_SALR5|nr:uncharacterized protein PTSG_11998 [Salpingoeca rosetta]EGD82695.1 hypothetical protein PTSG_11998 [Salpingoeca rosetta]|eukprot:XP_004995931.1 hypothetical protein PTSG_11998 [Salpingoeca rosetta]